MAADASFDLSGKRRADHRRRLRPGLRDRARAGRAGARVVAQRPRRAEARGGGGALRGDGARRQRRRFDVTDRGRRARRASPRSSAHGADRHPGQQRRRQSARQPLEEFTRRGLARADGREPDGPFLRHAGGAPGDEGAAPRQDHQHLLARERPRAAEHRPVCDEQGRARRCSRGRSRSSSPRRHPGQRHRARVLHDRDECCADRERRSSSAWVEKRTPAGRWGDPPEIAGAAVFLASPAADYVTGHVLRRRRVQRVVLSARTVPRVGAPGASPPGIIGASKRERRG